MSKMIIPVAAMRDPADSQECFIRVDFADNCNGSFCGNQYIDETGKEHFPPAHVHFVESGQSPKAGPRYYAIWTKVGPKG